MLGQTKQTHCVLLVFSLWAWSKNSRSQSSSTVSRAAECRAETRHFLNHSQAIWKCITQHIKMSLLSSLLWERNFSVVNNGFFSSKTRFQKLVNLVSAGTETPSHHFLFLSSLAGSIRDKKQLLEQEPHLFVSPEEPIDSKGQMLPRLLQAERAGSSVWQLSQLSGATRAWGLRLGPVCHLDSSTNKGLTSCKPAAHFRGSTTSSCVWPLKAPSIAWRYACRTREVEVFRVNAFLNQSRRATGTSTVRRLLHWESTETACTKVPSWTKQKEEKSQLE